MVDFPASVPPGAMPNPAGLVEVLLSVSLTGIMLLRPVYGTDGEEIIDFDWVRLNQAAQRMLRLPEHPAKSFLTLFPAAPQMGVFGFYRDAFLSGQLAHRQNLYQHDGLDSYYMLAAQRHEDVLVVSFIDSGDQDASLIETELRASRAREAAARAAERQRGELERVFEQAPVAIAVYRGPRYIIELANPTVCRLWGRTAAQIVGKGLFEALPEVAGMGYEELLDGVMTTGVPHVAHAMEAQHERHGRRETVYWDFVYVPMYETDGSIYGAMVVATEVTAQVEARRQLEEKERQTNFLNEELQAANEEILANNAELENTQQQLRQLNEALEARVAERTYQLDEQQSLLRQVLTQLPAAVATLSGAEHRFAFANASYQQLVAGRAELGKSVAEMMPELTEQGIIDLLDHVYTSREPFIGREIALMMAPAGAAPVQHYFDFTYQPLIDGQNQVQGLLVFAIDVTEQVRTRRQTETLQAAMLAVAQRQQAERENVYQLFEQSPAAICLLREPDHRIEYHNPAYQALLPGQVLAGRTLAQVQPEATELLALFDEVYTTGRPQMQLEVPVAGEAPAGGPAPTRYFDFTYQAYREQGRIVGVSLFGTDVTDRVLARQQRDAQQQELQRIFEQAPVAIAIMRGPRLVIELANAAVGAIWGRPPAQTLGRPYFEALPDTAGQGFEEILDGVLQTGEPFAIKEAPVQLARAHTGLPTLSYVNFIFQPLFDEQRQISGLIAMGTEVTDQVLARQQVQGLNEELQATNQELNDTNTRLTRTNADLDTFVYSASHDLKSPITNIEGLLLALRQQLPPEALQAGLVPKLLGMMDGAVSRFQQTLGHLTDVSRLQQLLADQPAEVVALPALVEAVRLDMLPELTAAGATLEVDVADCPTVHFSAKNLRSILYNLLSNAVKYRAPGRAPLVQLRCRSTAGQLVLEVQDNGLGLSEQQQTELFQLFRRLHSHVAGSGVGLYMVKKMVDNARGTLTVQSQPGLGSTFTVMLPPPAAPPA